MADTQALTTLLQTHLGLYALWSEVVDREGVRVQFLDAGKTKIELLEAIGPDSPVAKFVKNRKGGLHHLAFEVPDIEAELHRWKRRGFTPLSPVPTRGAGGKRIFFLHPKETAGVLIEFCEHPKRRPCIALISPSDAASLARTLRAHARFVAAPSMQQAHQHLVRSGIARAHFVVMGGSAEAALAFADNNREVCLSLTLHDAALPHSTAPSAGPVPVLVSAPDVSADNAVRLHRRVPGSRLCILPTAPQMPGQVDPALLAPVLLAHTKNSAPR